MAENDSKQKGKISILPLVVVAQFFLTVSGGGMLGAGLIAGFKVGWNMEAENNLGKIAVLLSGFGGLMFLAGIGVSVLLFKIVTDFYKNGSRS